MTKVQAIEKIKEELKGVDVELLDIDNIVEQFKKLKQGR